jgi:hypothetical protein
MYRPEAEISASGLFCAEPILGYCQVSRQGPFQSEVIGRHTFETIQKQE